LGDFGGGGAMCVGVEVTVMPEIQLAQRLTKGFAPSVPEPLAQLTSQVPPEKAKENDLMRGALPG
jgi:hypothetical protein